MFPTRPGNDVCHGPAGQGGARVFFGRCEKAGEGNYQSMINAALREHIQRQREPLEDTLQRVLREELRCTV